MTRFLETAASESFKGVNDLVFARSGNLYFTDQGQTGMHDPTGRVYKLTPEGRLTCLVTTIPSPNGIVVDIGRAHEALKTTLAPLSYRNLDDLPQFKGINTTTEFVTKHVFDALAAAVRADALGRSGREIKSLRITVLESPSACAWYEAPLW